MRKSLLASIAVLGLAAPVFAQGTNSSTMSPPSPNSSQGVPQPTNSLPTGGGTATGPSLGTVTTTGPTAAPMGGTAPMTGIQPMRPPMRRAMRRPPMRGHVTAMPGNTGARPGNVPGSGNSLPTSGQASNIDRADTRGDIAPRLPVPAANGNTAEAYLTAASRSLSRRQTGAAQEALERAETRLLDRSVPAGQANMPEQDPRLTQIADARRALASRDYAGAQRSIQAAMQMGQGQPGMGQPMGQPGMGQPMSQPGMGQPGMSQPGMAPAAGMPR